MYSSLAPSPQVLQLLDCMGLAVYRDKFSQEQVSGEILAECDEQVLQNDLGISSKLHRMRLLKVITGMLATQCLVLVGGYWNFGVVLTQHKLNLETPCFFTYSLRYFMFVNLMIHTPQGDIPVGTY